MKTQIEFVDPSPKEEKWLTFDQLLKQGEGFFEVKDSPGMIMILNCIRHLICITENHIVIPEHNSSWKKAFFKRMPQTELKLTIKMGIY